MMKKYLPVLVFIAVPIILAMGGSGGGPADRIPAAARNVGAIFIDQNDIVTECTGASIDGNTFLEGKKGQGTYTIDFEKIKSVVFKMNNGELLGTAKLVGGGETTLVLDKNKKAYGRTKFGSFQIRIAGLKKMTITSVSNPEKNAGTK
jgi:hypothetical protein